MSEFEKHLNQAVHGKQRNIKIFVLFPRNALSRRPGAAYNAAGDFTVYVTETIFITTEFIEEILCVIIPAPPIFKLPQNAPQNCLNGLRPCKFPALELCHGRDDIQMNMGQEPRADLHACRGVFEPMYTTCSEECMNLSDAWNAWAAEMLLMCFAIYAAKDQEPKNKSQGPSIKDHEGAMDQEILDQDQDHKICVYVNDPEPNTKDSAGPGTRSQVAKYIYIYIYK